MATGQKKFSFLGLIVVVVIFGGIAYFSRGPYKAAITIHELLTENKELRQAITNLTEEGQIGYAKVIKQETVDGKLMTTIKFVETARDDQTKKILEKEYTVEGDIVHFDALIVKFDNKMVTDGKARALYLWRRVYGEKMAPDEGFVIEEPGVEPQRYKDLLKALPIEHRQLFWSKIWDLANDRDKLAEYNIVAIYGNGIYSKLKPGLIYVFKLTASGDFYREVIPAI
ncbi:MAG: hypothetical protein JW715_11120 [Sedimentisphaerales bacterium]|nr:hypothetical protein [Sedimentisphaerales bacterium]